MAECPRWVYGAVRPEDAGYAAFLWSYVDGRDVRALLDQRPAEADDLFDVWPSQSTVAEELGVARTTVMRALGRLMKAGVIARRAKETRNGRSVKVLYLRLAPPAADADVRPRVTRDASTHRAPTHHNECAHAPEVMRPRTGSDAPTHTESSNQSSNESSRESSNPAPQAALFDESAPTRLSPKPKRDSLTDAEVDLLLDAWLDARKRVAERTKPARAPRRPKATPKIREFLLSAVRALVKLGEIERHEAPAELARLIRRKGEAAYREPGGEKWLTWAHFTRPANLDRLWRAEHLDSAETPVDAAGYALRGCPEPEYFDGVEYGEHEEVPGCRF